MNIGSSLCTAMNFSCNINKCRVVGVNVDCALQVVSVDERLDAFLDVGGARRELAGELLLDQKDQFLVQ